ncbi:Sjogren's syndrome/scleroderma autoantigen 1 family protein [Methanococcoides sp. NM1]|uniref:Sjogren's syndrome/scleroderma autoantigen 1 family protein n=1 Tax=Methanococcoides sp. NM1 TaxID=1201013 RepID=UPI0010828035|nr:Sjogren's syndrome/scleroderma autoantigen 1 family protein [Methanococcoides sp. NM1]
MSDSDDKIKQISRLLELGGTMLAQHCTTCGAPMFRYHGDVLCPLCQGEGVGTDMDSQEQMMRPEASTVPQKAAVQGATTFSEPAGQLPADQVPISFAFPDVRSESVPTSPIKHVEGMGSVADMLKMKLESIASLIQSENDPRRIREYLEIMEKCLDILERLN